MGDFSNIQFKVMTIYKHYILCFNPENKANDCVIIDTQMESVTSTSTGLSLGVSTDFSIYYWKDNTFVILGKTPSVDNLFGHTKMRFKIHRLQVNEKDCLQLS